MKTENISSVSFGSRIVKTNAIKDAQECAFLLLNNKAKIVQRLARDFFESRANILNDGKHDVFKLKYNSSRSLISFDLYRNGEKVLEDFIPKAKTKSAGYKSMQMVKYIASGNIPEAKGTWPHRSRIMIAKGFDKLFGLFDKLN